MLSETPNRMKIQPETHKKESDEVWKRPYNSPYGTSNYHRDYTKKHPEKTDYITDSSNKIKY